MPKNMWLLKKHFLPMHLRKFQDNVDNDFIASLASFIKSCKLKKDFENFELTLKIAFKIT